MAASWLIVALRVDNTAAADLAKQVVSDSTIGTTGTPPKYLGRRIVEGITQEMLREANTIASKANSGEIARRVVDIKTAIDRIKEQVQNVE